VPTADRRAAVVLALCALTGFAVLTILVLGLDVDGWDSAALRAVKHLHSAPLTTVIRDITALGGIPWVVPLTAAAAAAALLLRRPRAAALVVLAFAGGELLQLGFKPLFGRARPHVFPPPEHIANAAYPSGHALVSASLAFALVALCWEGRWRVPVAVLAALYVVAVGFSRVYLGVHYPSDVLAGWLLGAAWVAGLSAVLAPIRRRSGPQDTSAGTAGVNDRGRTAG